MHARQSPFNEYELGARYWRKLHELAQLRTRSPRQQTLALLQWALERAYQGDEVELTQEQLAHLVDDESLAAA